MNHFTGNFHFENTGSPVPQLRGTTVTHPVPATVTPSNITTHGASRPSESSNASNVFVDASGDILDAFGVRERAATLRLHSTSSPSPSSHPTELLAAALGPGPGHMPSFESVPRFDSPSLVDQPNRDSERRDNVKLWALRIGNQFGLKPSQYSDLVGFVELGENLDFGNLRILIWQQAMLYQILNAIETSSLNYAMYKDAMETAAAQLADVFQLSKDQKNQVRILAKDLIVQPGRFKYMTIHHDVEGHLKLHAEVLGFKNIFGNAVREQAMRSTIAKECSAARNRLRGYVVSKLKRGGVGTDLKIEFQLHLALLRYHSKDHRYLISPIKGDGTASDEDGEDGDEDDGDDADGIDHDGDEPPSKRKKVSSKAAPPGRVRKGQDFWSAMDKALAKDVERLGKDMKDTKWRE
ncbi:hypothetical protein HYDPIDRAFT_34876 [Hydnomerulius pinastri MD-312]|uniref:Unplaced genomic scaffold scaffold_341, whole genome shotgun sequence n=1 Tax=Hydnomerulius pinastri MD-312 TaxID=994086 RepID=A0A0C9VJS9_9AGAM|nr:hypothetical protein HYDPIDRAFT_34876 [Hydnomerulius pinastri MD-312]